VSVRDGSTGETAPVRVLIVDDDDGDAMLVEELFADSALEVVLDRARSIDEALGRLDVDCVLLDLGLPDATGLSGVERINATGTSAALVVLTGMTSSDLGVEAVAAGAQDYLVKHEVDPDLLARSVRYAVQRRLSDEQARTIYKSSVRARETARLERALLPTPSIVDPRLSVLVGYLPGGDGLLGGDFYDVVERDDGTLASRQPLRVVVGRRDLPAGLRVLDDSAPTRLVREHDPHAVLAALDDVNDVLVEGGATLAAAFLDADLVDRLVVYLAPTVLGAGRSAVESSSVGTLADAHGFRRESVTVLGDDLRLDLVPVAAPSHPAAAPSHPAAGPSHPAARTQQEQTCSPE